MAKTNLFWSDFTEPPDARNPEKPDRCAAARTAARVAGYVLLATAALCLSTILLLRWVPTPTSAFMLWHRLGGDPVAYRWTPLQRIAPALPIAVVAAEDQRFPQHWGFDFEAIADAIEENQRRERPRGASTLSQQVAKNLFLWSGGGWARKGLEAGLTLAIEICWPKRRILEVYLNIAQFGPNVFGADAASRHYFNRPPSRLTLHQAALLSAALPNPRTHRISPPSAYVARRAAHIRHQVDLLGGPAYLDSILRDEK